jgi:hypothetical protein
MKCTVAFTGYSELLSPPEGLGGGWVMYVIVLNDVSSFETGYGAEILGMSLPVCSWFFHFPGSQYSQLTSSDADCGRL